MGIDLFPRYIQQGERVAPGVPNRVTRTIQQNVEYLYSLIQAANLGSAVFARSVPVSSGTAVGDSVYFDAATATFKPGLMQAQLDEATGEYVPGPTAEIWGVVYSKSSATLADVVLLGYVELDISEAVGGTPQATTYYLSSVSPGKLVTAQIVPSLPILRSDGQGHVLVFPQFRDVLDRHRHVHFDLVARPAGTHVPPAPGQRHEITAADSALAGWLPASDPVFENLAPVGAVFGYNFSAHPALDSLWPPIPLQGAVLEIDRATDAAQGFHGVPLGPLGLCTIDRYGIWWMHDCYGDVPWPTDLDTTVAGDSESASESVECPRTQAFALRLWFTKPAASTTPSFVTSLRSVDSRIKVYCLGTTTPKTVGDLELLLELDQALGEHDRLGGLAMKDLDPDGTIHRGPVLVGLRAATSNVQLSGGSTFTIDSAPYRFGLLSLSVLDETDRELRPLLTRLDGVTEESSPVLYLGFPDDFATRFMAQFEVPMSSPASTFQYRLRLLGRAAGTLPQLTVTYAVVNRPPDGLATPEAVAPTWASLTIDTTGVLANANESVEATSETIVVAPGDLVLVRVERDPTDVGDGYAGELGVMQQVGILTVV